MCNFHIKKHVFVTILFGLIVQYVYSPTYSATEVAWRARDHKICAQRKHSNKDPIGDDEIFSNRESQVQSKEEVYECEQIDGYIPGQDYPIYHEIPQGLSFRCDQKLPGYYSDPEAQCQVWHWCLPNGQKYSFLCPNGTVFNQYARVCDWWFNVDCAATPNLYGINEDLYRVPNYVEKQNRQQ